jgi:hypothetical protein
MPLVIAVLFMGCSLATARSPDPRSLPSTVTDAQLTLSVPDSVFARIALPRPLDAPAGLPFSLRHHLQRLDIEHRLRQELLQLRVLALELA